jgi:hypothetical protein
LKRDYYSIDQIAEKFKTDAETIRQQAENNHLTLHFKIPSSTLATAPDIVASISVLCPENIMNAHSTFEMIDYPLFCDKLYELPLSEISRNEAHGKNWIVSKAIVKSDPFDDDSNPCLATFDDINIPQSSIFILREAVQHALDVVNPTGTGKQYLRENALKRYILENSIPTTGHGYTKNQIWMTLSQRYPNLFSISTQGATDFWKKQNLIKFKAGRPLKYQGI